MAATSTPQRAPLGTPSRPPPNTPFSHIQIVPKVSPKANEMSLSQPMFRKKSLSYEVEEKDDAVTSVSSTVESLANKPQGTTFAARARAAELVASRSRISFTGEKRQEEPIIPLETMKFTKPRTKPTRAWKPLDLADLPETLSEIGHNNDNTKNLRTDYAVYNGNTVQHILSGSNENENLQPHNFPRLGGAESESDLSPDSRALEQLIEAYNASEWDPDMPSTSTKDSQSPSHRSGSEVSRQDSNALLEIPGLLTLSKSPNSYKPVKNIESFNHPRMVATRLSDDNSIFQGRKPMGTRVLAPTVLNHFRTDGIQDSAIEDPFADSPQRLRDFPFPEVLHDSSPAKYAPTRPFTHKHPAVKGTMDYKFQFLPEHLTPLNAQSQQRSTSQLSSNQMLYSQPAYYTPGIATFGRTSPCRRLSDEDKQDMLNHLNTIVEKQAGLRNSTRTVLHDPVVYADTALLATALSPEAKLTRPETEFVKQSDPLPWRTRPVDVVPTPALSNAELTVMSTSKSEPRLRSTQPLSKEAPAPLPVDDTFAEAEAWFRTDNRMTLQGQECFATFLNNPAITQRENKKALIEVAAKSALRRANMSKEWSDGSLSTNVPDESGKRDVSHTLMVPVLANLSLYLDPAGYFGRFGPAPEWCIDQGPSGQSSFFGEDWGAPPPRVGRDPRYRPMLHDGRYTVFEDMGIRGNSGGFGRRVR